VSDVKKVQTVLSVLSGACLAVVFLVTFAQVIQRYVFQMAMPWSTDVIRIFFVYSVFLGMAVGVLKKAHLNIDVVVHALPEAVRAKLDIVSNVIVTVFLASVFWYSFRFITANADQYTPYLMFPMSYVYAIIPLCVSVMIVFLVVDTYRSVFGSPRKGGDAA
jgi:TRAP-type C4-dicarboxylate transport system permease small subunit